MHYKKQLVQHNKNKNKININNEGNEDGNGGKIEDSKWREEENFLLAYLRILDCMMEHISTKEDGFGCLTSFGGTQLLCSILSSFPSSFTLSQLAQHVILGMCLRVGCEIDHEIDFDFE